jgi:hypothetical protein
MRWRRYEPLVDVPHGVHNGLQIVAKWEAESSGFLRRQLERQCWSPERLRIEHRLRDSAGLVDNHKCMACVDAWKRRVPVSWLAALGNQLVADAPLGTEFAAPW